MAGGSLPLPCLFVCNSSFSLSCPLLPLVTVTVTACYCAAFLFYLTYLLELLLVYPAVGFGLAALSSYRHSDPALNNVYSLLSPGLLHSHLLCGLLALELFLFAYNWSPRCILEVPTDVFSQWRRHLPRRQSFEPPRRLDSEQDTTGTSHMPLDTRRE